MEKVKQKNKIERRNLLEEIKNLPGVFLSDWLKTLSKEELIEYDFLIEKLKNEETTN